MGDGVKSMGDHSFVSCLLDFRIEPITCGVKQWETYNGTPIIWIARKEGVKVLKEENQT